MTTTLSYDAIVNGLRELGVPRDRAELEARRQLGVPVVPIATPDVDAGALEKVIEHEGDKLMQKLGFEIIKFSHPGKTKQTEGIADRRYYRRPRTDERPDGRYHVPAIAVWWEAKSATGEQRTGQKLFQELVTACGEHYVLGTHEALIAWLLEQRIAERDGDGLLPCER